MTKTTALTPTDPHAYNDYEHFTFTHAQKPYLEFPVEQSGVYDGQSPGADRVVIGSIAEDYSSAVFCAVITHDGQKKNGFTECADDTMNVRGKGQYQGGAEQGAGGNGGQGQGQGQGQGHGHKHGHGHHGKKLLERIDL